MSEEAHQQRLKRIEEINEMLRLTIGTRWGSEFLEELKDIVLEEVAYHRQLKDIHS